MFYTPIWSHSLSKVTENYHRIFAHEQLNMSTFKVGFIRLSQLSSPVHHLLCIQNEIFYQNYSYPTLKIYWSPCNHIKLHNTWLQDTYRICMKEDLLHNILYISVTVATQIQRFLLNKSCTIWLFIKGFLPSLAGTGVFLFKALFKEQKD